MDEEDDNSAEYKYSVSSNNSISSQRSPAHKRRNQQLALKSKFYSGPTNVKCDLCDGTIQNGDNVAVLPCQHEVHSLCAKRGERSSHRNHHPCPVCQRNTAGTTTKTTTMMTTTTPSTPLRPTNKARGCSGVAGSKTHAILCSVEGGERKFSLTCEDNTDKMESVMEKITTINTMNSFCHSPTSTVIESNHKAVDQKVFFWRSDEGRLLDDDEMLGSGLPLRVQARKNSIFSCSDSSDSECSSSEDESWDKKSPSCARNENVNHKQIVMETKEWRGYRRFYM